MSKVCTKTNMNWLSVVQAVNFVSSMLVEKFVEISVWGHVKK